jgi:hypothetical protein
MNSVFPETISFGNTYTSESGSAISDTEKVLESLQY